jgi:hypothetical protein
MPYGEGVWGWGSRAELLLLSPHAREDPQNEAAQAALGEVVARASGRSSFAVMSAQRELRRYVDWWTSANGFFWDGPDLAAEALSPRRRRPWIEDAPVDAA